MLQGSAKLEKAEILQLTVEFLQRLHKEGYVLGSEARSIELRRIGFKDCLLEVTRLLSTYDGINISGQELSRHLLNHLHQCEKQRDLETKTYLANIASVANAMYSKVNSSNSTATTTTNIVSQHHQLQCQSYLHSHQQYNLNHANSSNSVKSKYSKNNSRVNEQLELLDKQSTTLSLTNNSVNLLQTNACHQNDAYYTSSTFQNSRNNYTSYHSVDCKMNEEQTSHKSPYKLEDRYSEQLPNCFLQTNTFYPNYMYNEYWNKCSPYTTSSYLSTSTTTTTVSNGNGIITCESNYLNTNYHTFSNFSNTTYSTVNTNNSNIGNSQLSTGLGPNESQSTSSPPFRSTPEESDIGFSPHLKINLSNIVGNDEIEDDCNYYNRECTGGFITSTTTTTVSASNMTAAPMKPILTKEFYQQSHYDNNHEYAYHQKNDVGMNLSGNYQCSPIKSHPYPMNNNEIHSRHLSNIYNNQYNHSLYSNSPNNTWNHIGRTTDLIQYQANLLHHSHAPTSVLNTNERISLSTIPLSTISHSFSSITNTTTTTTTTVCSMNNRIVSELRE
ncbi:unnamed protein product [Schistosoma mattheei]|uniref:Uncharacterized protein n=1 Tax=Schistosoma mattheei TaxID=31246 RepID=A0A183P751_9TREM|nr:unnamed protein product [Schistosoma mattheei]